MSLSYARSDQRLTNGLRVVFHTDRTAPLFAVNIWYGVGSRHEQLHRTGFANMATSTHPHDGLQLSDAYVACAVRCAPPDNKPLPEEISRCLDHLDAEVAHLPHVRVVVALGKIGFDAWLQLLRRRGGVPSPRPQFGHGVVVKMGEGLPTLIGCYHPSRQNTNTGRLTPAMMESVFKKARRLISRP